MLWICCSPIMIFMIEEFLCGRFFCMLCYVTWMDKADPIGWALLNKPTTFTSRLFVRPCKNPMYLLFVAELTVLAYGSEWAETWFMYLVSHDRHSNSIITGTSHYLEIISQYRYSMTILKIILQAMALINYYCMFISIWLRRNQIVYIRGGEPFSDWVPIFSVLKRKMLLRAK